MCLHPIMMYDTGQLSPSGKRKYTFRAPVGFPSAGIPVPCGKCLPCLESRRREWCKRLLLESTLWPVSSFITLTYADEHLPWCRLACKRHVQKFLKRFRQIPRDFAVPSFSFRYFVAAEYGSKRFRPHYHGLFFGVDLLSDVWRPRLVSFGKYPIFTSDLLADVWGLGFVTVDRLTPSNISYVSKYITKQSDKSRPTWSLKSIGLARSLFASKDGLTDFGSSSVRSGFVAVPSRGSPSRVRVPRFVDRYVERFDPPLFESVKASRLSYVRSLPVADLAMLRDWHDYNHGLENTNRKLDNEC